MSRALLLTTILLVGAVIALAVFAQDDAALPFDRTARLERIDLELRQIATEQQRLADERRGLIRERGCVARSATRQAMRACSL